MVTTRVWLSSTIAVPPTTVSAASAKINNRAGKSESGPRSCFDCPVLSKNGIHFLDGLFIVEAVVSVKAVGWTSA